jgi:hypothetical protein
MESITGFSMESCERNIKFYKKMLKGQVLWVMFNLAITCFDWSVLDAPHTKLTGIGFGAMIITSIWSIMFLIETWSEWSNEKLRLKFLTELHDAQLASGERQQYKNAREHYESVLTQIIKEYPEIKDKYVRPSEPSAPL